MNKVMVIDDTKNIRTLLTTCLQLEGYDVIEGKNGVEALEIIENHKIDIAFIDVKMPGMSGTELLRKVRAKGKNFTVVIMTAFPTIKNAVDCTKLGAVAYLQKPFTAERVRNLLGEISEDINANNNLYKYIENAKNLMEEGNIDDALSLLKKALSVDPKCSEAYYLMSKIYGVKGSLNESNKFYEVSRLFGHDCD